MSTRLSTRTRRRVPSFARGLLDTSVVIDFEVIPESLLPIESAISAITLAELAVGPHATADIDERARRQERLQRAEAQFTAIPFDVNAARAYGSVYAATTKVGRHSRARVADFLIAATAIAAGLPLYTRNADDFAHLAELVKVIAI